MLESRQATQSSSRHQLGQREWQSILRALSYIVVGVGAFTMLVPFFWMLSTSFKPERGVFKMPPEWIPRPFTTEHYEEVWRVNDMARGMWNSFFVASTSTAGEIFTSTLAGFAFARIRFRGRNVLFGMLLLTMMIPGVVTMIPAFILFRELGWLNTFKPLIVPLLFGTPFALFLSRQFFTGLPRELEDAGKVDGANFFQIYWRIFMPQAKPLVATLFVLGFMARWNDFLGPLIYVQGKAELYTLPLQLARLNTLYIQKWSMLMAGSMIALLPILILFLLLQRFFIESVAFSGIKG
jgi:multiple sugar transport system permease protein